MGIRRWSAAAALAGIASAACSAPDVEFGEPRAVSAATNVGVAPMFAVSPSGEEATAWISAPGGGTDGRLYVSVGDAPPAELRDSLGPIEAHAEAPPKIAYAPDGSLHAVYVVAKVEPGRRFPLAALRHTRSADGGRTWSAPKTVTDDGDFGSHNFHALHVANDGRAYVAWLDGRAGKSGAYITWSADAGATWAPNVRVSIEEACPCCRTAIASDSGGVVYLAWRTVGVGNVRDVVVARSNDGGATWSAPRRAHADDWVYEGCPHAGPAMVVDASHRLHIVWWTGKPGDAGVFYARADHENHFGNRVTMAAADASRPAHVQLAVDGETVAVTWDDGIRQTPTIRMRLSRDGGNAFGAEVVASPRNLVATFPVLAFANGGLTVAWTEEDPSAHAHAQASHPDMSDPNAVKGLTAVGEARVVARRGTVRN
jgi:hypothetical protein